MPRRSSQGPRLGCAFYRTDVGHEPVREWLRSLGKEVSKAIGSDILTVQWSWPVGKPLVDGFGGALYEIRSTYDRKEYRVFFCIAPPSWCCFTASRRRRERRALLTWNSPASGSERSWHHEQKAHRLYPELLPRGDEHS